MMKITHIIVETGYTRRLVEEEMNEWFEENDAVLIQDTLPNGTQVWVFAQGVSLDDQNKLKKIITEQNLDGVVVFKRDITVTKKRQLRDEEDSCVDLLEEADYCCSCNMKSVYERKVVEDVYIVRVDCESG